MTSVERNIKILKGVVIFAALIILVAHFWFWLDPQSFGAISAKHEIISEYGGVEALDKYQQILGFAITAVPKIALLWALALLVRLANILSAGNWFGRECEDCCVSIGRWLVLFVVLSVLHRTLLVLVITMHYPPGERLLAFFISNDDLMTIVPALLALIIGHMVRLARAQRDELNEIV